MGKPFLLQLSSVLVQQRDLLKLGMVIDSYNDHCPAPFSRACWLAYAPPTLLGSGSRHCHGINYTNHWVALNFTNHCAALPDYPYPQHTVETTCSLNQNSGSR